MPKPGPQSGRANPGGGGSPGPHPLNPQAVQYYTPDGAIRPELLDAEADNFAQELVKTKKLTTTQLRRYYNEVINLQRRLDEMTAGGSREQAFERLRADFKLLKAKAYYAYGRNKEIFPKELLQFFVNHTHAVRTVRDFDAFCRHFQAVVGFHKYYKGD